jgi:hypothetical protein
MGQVGFQDFWVTGSRFYFERDAIGGTTYVPMLDLGRIEVTSPNSQPQVIELKDADGGVLKLIDRATVDYNEKYSITCSNLNMDNLALLFGANQAQSFSQSGGAVTGTTLHKVFVGRIFKIYDNSTIPVPVYNVASIQAVKVGSTTLTLGTDYEVVSLSRGLIRVISTTVAVVDGDNLTVNYTLTAVSGKRLVNPQDTGGDTVQGKGYIFWGRANNVRQTVREARVAISPGAGNFQVTDFSNFVLDVSVLNDPTQAVPAGRLLQFIGSLPTAAS